MRRELRVHPAALIAALRGRVRALFARATLERGLAEEVRFHLDMEIEKNLRAGMAPGEARRAARLAFGGVDTMTEAHRDARGTRAVEDIIADLRHAARALARAPGFVAVSIVTLALAIAIGTTLFTAVNSFFSRPLPVPNGASLIAVFTSDFNGRERLGASSYPDIMEFARAAGSVADVAGQARVQFGIGVGDHIAMTQGAIVSPGYFQMLGVSPVLGRFPRAAQPAFPAIVLSYALWRRAFGSDSALVGRQVSVNGQAFTVVAIAARAFRGTSREIADDFWIDGAFAPLVMPRDDITRNRAARRFHVLARLRDDAAPAALQGRLNAAALQLSQAYPDAWRDTTGTGRTITAMPERDAFIANIPPATRLIVMGGVMALALALLAIASANLASVQIARGAARRREIATRLALGASRGRVVRHLLAECTLVAVPGAVIGVAAALLAARLIEYRLPIPSINLTPDWRTLVFIVGALLMVVLIFGLVPALQTVRPNLLADLPGYDRPGAGGVRVGGLRGALIIGQVALSVGFTAASIMVAVALARHASVGRAEARNVLVAQVTFLPEAGDSGAVRALTDALMAEIAAIPGVEAASAADFIPVRGRRRTVSAEIDVSAGGVRRLVLDANAVGPGYFTVVGLPIVQGRDFEGRDARSAHQVVLVSRAMANALWPSENPIGKRMRIERQSGAASAEVVGVVADAVGQGPATAESYPGLLYVPLRPEAEADIVLHVRAPRVQVAVAGQMAQRLRRERTRLAAPEVMTLDRYYDRVVLPQRLLAQGAGIAAALQVLLAAAGLSGLVAYVTTLRRREIGIRTALGASPASVLRLVMRQGLRLITIGGAIGAALGIAISRVVAESLPLSLPMVLGAVALAACVIAAAGAIAMRLPAQRALEVAPAVTLRVD